MGDGLNVFAALVGDRSSEWLFSISAQSQEDLDALIEVFIEVAVAEQPVGWQNPIRPSRIGVPVA